MESIQDVESSEAAQQTEPRKVSILLGQFNWRMILIRVLVNSLTLILISVLLPTIYFADRRLLNVLFLALMLGILNAVVKPVIQFLTLPLIFASYGFVVVAINTLMLLLLSALFPERYVVDSLIWAIIGGALMGLIASVLESLFGLNIPIGVKLDTPGIQEGQPGVRPNPVRSRLIKGSEAQEEAGPFSQEETSAAPVEEAAAEQEEVAAESKPVAESGPVAGVALDETDSDRRTTQPGDNQ